MILQKQQTKYATFQLWRMVLPTKESLDTLQQFDFREKLLQLQEGEQSDFQFIEHTLFSLLFD